MCEIISRVILTLNVISHAVYEGAGMRPKKKAAEAALHKRERRQCYCRIRQMESVFQLANWVAAHFVSLSL